MALIPRFLLQHRATIEPYLGTSAKGPQYGPPVTVRCLAVDKRKLVRGADQDQVISSAQVFCRPGVVAPVHSRVTVNGRSATVITLDNADGGFLPTPDHIQLYLT
jgi:hypothetical protein